MSFAQLGIVSTVPIACQLLPHLRRHGFDVRALWTPQSMEETLAIAAEFEIPFTAAQPKEVLLRRDVQLVIVSGVPHLHTELVVASLGIGKHVFAEPPLALSMTDVRQLSHAAQYYPTRLLAISGTGSLRFLPAASAMRQRVSQGSLGRILSVEARVRLGPSALLTRNLTSDGLHTLLDWTHDSATGGGILNIIGVPLLDLICFVVGQRATHACGFAQKAVTPHNFGLNEIYRVDADGSAAVSVQLESGAPVSLSLQANMPGVFDMELLVAGSEGYLRMVNERLYFAQHKHMKPELELEDHSLKEIFARPDTALYSLLRHSVMRLFKCLSQHMTDETDTTPTDDGQTNGQSVHSVPDSDKPSQEDDNILLALPDFPNMQDACHAYTLLQAIREPNQYQT